MHYELITYQGVSMMMNSEFDFKGFVSAINSQEVQAVTVSGISTLKSNIQFIKPIYDEGETPAGETILIYPRGAQPFEAHAESYDATQITSQINGQRNSFIIIGDTAIHRNEYSLVMAAPAQ